MHRLLEIGVSNALVAAVLALIVASVSAYCKSPALRHSLWLLVLLKLVTPAFIEVRTPALIRDFGRRPVVDAAAPVLETTTSVNATVIDSEPAPASPFLHIPETVAESPRETDRRELSSQTVQISSEAILAIVWLAGAVTWWSIAAVRCFRFQRLLRLGRPANRTLVAQVAALAHRIGLAFSPEVLIVAAPLSPMLWAIGRRACLILPADLWDRLSGEQRDALLLHELAHLRRRDHWVRRLELIVIGLYWWHPVAWWARRELQEAAEECCDAWVVWALPQATAAYASALVETLAFISTARAPLPLTASGAGGTRLIKRRLRMILRGASSRTLNWSGLLVVMALAALLLPLLPTLADPPDRVVNPLADVFAAPAEEAAVPILIGAGDESNPFQPDAGQQRAVNAQNSRPARNASAGGVDRDARRILKEQMEELRDEIELLEAQLDVKRAALQAAAVEFDGAKERAARLSKLKSTGAISEGEHSRAQADLANQEAKFLIKRAELKEPEVRLRQTKRRLDRLSEEAKALEPSAEFSAKLLFVDLVKDFGQVQSGSDVTYRFPIRNPTDQTFRIKSIRASGSFATASASSVEIEPGTTAGIVGKINTRRFSGSKVVMIHVDFDRPRAETVTLNVIVESVAQALNRASKLVDPRPELPPEPEWKNKMRDLELRLEKLLHEIEALRAEIRKRPISAVPPQPATTIEKKLTSPAERQYDDPRSVPARPLSPKEKR